MVYIFVKIVKILFFLKRLLFEVSLIRGRSSTKTLAFRIKILVTTQVLGVLRLWVLSIEIIVCFPICKHRIGEHTVVSILNTHNLNTIST